MVNLPVKGVFLVFVIVLFIVESAATQVSFSGYYSALSAPGWKNAIESKANGELHDWNGFNVSVASYFRLKEKRLEFEPELGFSKNRATMADASISTQKVALGLNILYYPFDFYNDCNCPVWAKPGNVFDKGFFLLLYGGGAWFERKFNSNSFQDTDISLQEFFGFGAGLDLGLSEVLTFTPLFRRVYYPQVDWKYISGNETEVSFVKNWQVGLKIGVRFKQ